MALNKKLIFGTVGGVALTLASVFGYKALTQEEPLPPGYKTVRCELIDDQGNPSNKPCEPVVN